MYARIRLYLELCKTGIVAMVVATSSLGYFAAYGSIGSWYIWFVTVLGTAISCSGASALNHYLERDADAKMERTKNRPLPSGRLNPNNALLFGVICSVLGTVLLAWQVNLLCGFLGLLTVFLYALVYTPLKKTTWLNTMIGAVPGALPIMGGWAAATNSLELGSWVLFGIMFAWQHPHFYSIAWICREDYERGGFKMLPVIDQKGVETFGHIIAFSLALMIISIVPTVIGMSGISYLFCALILGIMMIVYSLIAARTHSYRDSKRLFLFSLVYLPALFSTIVLDRFL